eukprot:s44_g25.t1
MPVDKTSARASQVFIARYDITNPDEFAALLDLLRTEHHRIVAVHLAPACGTASKAREKKLKSFAKRGFKIPKPLRSKTKPMGLDGLEGVDKLRTELANQVYTATAEIAQLCIALDILCSIENPQNSLFWDFPDIVAMLTVFPGFHVTFDSCMHGGARKKNTGWWATKPVYAELALLCDESHTHAQWNPTPVGGALKFPTAEEAAYPVMLCKRVAGILYKYALERRTINPDNLQEQLPTRARIVQRRLQWGKVRVSEQSNNGLLWESDGKSTELDAESPIGSAATNWGSIQAELCTVGIPRDPWDFLERAVAVGHPRSLAVHLNQEVAAMLRENFSGDQCALVKTRAEFLMKWTSRCKELATEEQKLHDGLEPHLREVLNGKRLLLFGEMLQSLDYPDKSLVKDIINGFHLTGWMPKTGVFPPHLKRPAHNLDAAKKLAEGVNKSIVRQVSSNLDKDLDDTVWAMTEEEEAKGWVFFDDDCPVNEKLLAKRFGLRQGEKVRLIDDCSVGGFNGCCGSSEKMKVHSVDELAAYVCWCLTNLDSQAMSQVVGKTYDLKNAYKQYGICRADRDLLRLAVWDPVTKTVRYMGANALPFGAVGSVSGFLRISLAVWFLGVRGLRLCWTSFFDDFTLLSKQPSARSAALAAESLFSLLGLQYAKDGKKAVEWSTQVKTLGVVINLAPPRAHGSFVHIGHTSSRVEELEGTIKSFLETKTMTSKDAEKLRGESVVLSCTYK